MSSSDDFFNQSFTPPPPRRQTVTTSKRTTAAPPPPPPPPSSSTGIRPRPTSSTSSARPTIKLTGAKATRTSIAAGSNTSMRPTGNYYATASAEPAPAAPFMAYSGAGYGQSSSISSGSNTNDQSWYSAGSTSNSTSTNAYSNTSSAPSPYDLNPQQQHKQQQHQPVQSQPTQQPVSGQPQTTAGPSTMTSVQNTNSMEYLSGSMDNNANNNNNPMMMSGPMMMQPSTSSSNMNDPNASSNTTNHSNMNKNPSSSSFRYVYNPDDFADEPPLLEELGVNLNHIRTKSLAVILPVRYAKQAIDKNLMDDTDMAGPIAFAILLALELLLAGRLQFGYIYGFGLFGCLATTLIINLMSPSDSISIWTVVSILGYSLLPVNMLAALNIFYRIRLMGDIGVVLGMITIGWCTISSTRLFERGCGLRDQRYLIGYPSALLYSAFVLLTIF